MMRVNHESLEFLDENGIRIAEVRLSQLKLELSPTNLLLWAVVWQLVEINSRLGSYDPRQQKGSGLMGGIAQATLNGAHIGQEVSTIREHLERLAAAQPQNPADMRSLVNDALSAFKGVPGFGEAVAAAERANGGGPAAVVTQPAADALAASRQEQAEAEE